MTIADDGSFGGLQLKVSPQLSFLFLLEMFLFSQMGILTLSLDLVTM